MKFVNKTLMKVAGLMVLLVAVAAGCGVGGGGPSAAGPLADVDLSDADFTVGSKDFTEQLVLGQIAVQALEATGANITDQTGLAGTDAARAALESGEIDMYWEYSGTNWINFLGNTEPVFPAEEQYQASKEAELEENDIVLLARAPFNNTYALAMRSEAPQEVPELQDVTNLSDIGPLIENNPDVATLCVESEFRTRDDGLPGMEEKYGYQFPEGNVSLFDTGVVYERTDAGDPCNFGEVFTTDGRIQALDLTVLEDDENFFPIYNPAINIREETSNEYGDPLNTAFEPIAQELDTETMQTLNASVDVDGEAPEDVAQQWLQENGFLEE